MSRSFSVEFRLEAERRQRIFNNRVRSRTEPFYERYRAQQVELMERGAERYIPAEMRRLAADLNSMERLLKSDPAAARNVSFEVGSYIHGLHGLLRSAKCEFAEQERQQQEAVERARKEIADQVARTFHEFVAQMTPDIAHFARMDIGHIRQNLGEYQANGPAVLLKDLRLISAKAEEKANGWRKGQRKVQAEQSATARIKEVNDKICKDQPEDSTKHQKLLDALQGIQKMLDSGEDAADVLVKVAEIDKASDDLMVEEDIQKEVARDICQSILGMNFQLAQPMISEGIVYITAYTPEGNQVDITIDMDGQGTYDFHGYRGMICQKDIAAFKKSMEEIYLTKIIEKQQLWENPEKLEMSVNEMPISERGNNSWQ